MIIDSESYSDLDPLKSNEWSINLTTLDDQLDLQLTQLLQGFYDQLKKTISVSQILSSLVSVTDINSTIQAEDYKQSLERLTNPLTKTSTHRTLRSLMKPVEVWNSAKSVPVRKQKRLFDDTKEAEKVFEWLNMLTICNIVQELLPMLFYSSVLCVLKESKEIINDYEGLVDSLIDKTIKVTRNNRDDVKKYQVFSLS